MQIIERFFDDKVAINPNILSYFTLIFTDRKSRYKAHVPAKINTMPDIMKAVVYFHNYFLTPVKEWYKESRPRVTIHMYADNGGWHTPSL